MIFLSIHSQCGERKIYEPLKMQQSVDSEVENIFLLWIEIQIVEIGGIFINLSKWELYEWKQRHERWYEDRQWHKHVYGINVLLK